MTWMRGLAIFFWVFLALSFLWQCSSSPAVKMDRRGPGTQPPADPHYFYKKPSAVPAEVIKGARIVQVSYKVQENTPSPGRFTCIIVVKNVGVKKATHIQMQVRPFYGGQFTEDESTLRTEVFTPQSRTWQISDSLSFPDLAPGQSSPPQSISFDNQGNAPLGVNEKPPITFAEEKSP